MSRIKVQSAKAKGRRLQQWVCQKISELTGFAWGKDKPIESRSGGQNGVDVRLEQSVLSVFPFSVECKSQELWSVHEWVEQAQANKIHDTDWLLFVKRSREPALVVMGAEQFFAMLLRAKKLGELGKAR
jgi:hypothetical protein